ncbi:MAG: NUDIX hydrolase [Nanoarchaeota archaeon]
MIDRIQNSGCAIIDGDKLLLLWKIKRNHYEFPGGKVEPGESLEQAALRETKEELGCDVELIRYLCFKDFTVEGRHFRSHKFLAKIAQGQTPRVNEPTKFSHLFWLPMKEYKSYSVAPNVKEFCEDYIEGKLVL